MEEIKVKPCPFCGSVPMVTVEMVAPKGGEVQVKCSGCGTSGPVWPFGVGARGIVPPLAEVRRQAVRGWNQRIQDAGDPIY